MLFRSSTGRCELSNSGRLSLLLTGMRQYVSDDLDFVSQIDAFIQENLSSVKEAKSFLSLPQICVKLLGT